MEVALFIPMCCSSTISVVRAYQRCGHSLRRCSWPACASIPAGALRAVLRHYCSLAPSAHSEPQKWGQCGVRATWRAQTGLPSVRTSPLVQTRLRNGRLCRTLVGDWTGKIFRGDAAVGCLEAGNPHWWILCASLHSACATNSGVALPDPFAMLLFLLPGATNPLNASPLLTTLSHHESNHAPTTDGLC